MNLKGTIAKKFAGVGAVRIIGTGIAFLGHVTLARLLGTHEYGIFTYVFAWLTIISLFTRLGFDNMLIRFVSQFSVLKEWGKLKSLFIESFQKVTLLSIVVGLLGAFILYYFFPDRLQEQKATFIVGLIFCLPLVSIAYLRQSSLIGLKYVALSNIPVLIIRHCLFVIFILSFYLLSIELNAERAMFLNATAFLIIVIVASYWLKKRLPYDNATTVASNKGESWVKQAKDFLFISGANILNQRADIVTLGFFVVPEQVGIYAAVSRIIPIIGFASSIANTAFKPYISDYYSKNKMDALQKIVFVSAAFVGLFTFTISGSLFLFGDLVLNLFGEKFVQGYNILLVLLVGKIVAVITGPVAIILTMTNNQNIASKIEVSCTVLNITLNIVFIQIWGLIGAAFATAIVWILRNLLMLYVAYRELGINPTIFNKKQIMALIKSRA